MLVSYLTGKLNVLAAKWDGARERIRTPQQITERNRFVREKVGEMLGGYPERNPLDAVVVRTTERRGYRVENVMYQSRPNFWVTGNLYIPEGSGPFPAVISPCGHYPLARMYPDYQFVYMNLVHAGFVVLAYDPIGQGERRQFWHPDTGPEIDDSVYEHSLPGQVLLLMGENLTHYRVWDGMRSIDYLLTRPEVDREKIGCAGHSGRRHADALHQRGGRAREMRGGERRRHHASLAGLAAPVEPLALRGRRAELLSRRPLRRGPLRSAPGDRAAPAAGVDRELFAALQPGCRTIFACDTNNSACRKSSRRRKLTIRTPGP